MTTKKDTFLVVSGSKSHLFCTHCRRSGHKVDYCWAKYGLLNWWKNKGSHDGTYGRDRRGHGQQAAHNREPIASTDNILGITTAHWQQILNLLGKSTLSHPSDHLSSEYTPWLLDSGASHLQREIVIYLLTLVILPIIPMVFRMVNKFSPPYKARCNCVPISFFTMCIMCLL